MANTTNFNWETPDDTDLVKDGAAAIRTLGNSIDTSFVDLKGGTTGQILSKASNTDLDYTWIANDQGDLTAITAGSGISVTSGTGPIPTVALDLTAANTYTAAQTATAFIVTGSTTPSNGIYLPTTNSLGLTTNSTERLRITADGNVGIAATPAAGRSFQVGRVMTGNASSVLGIVSAGVIQSDATGAARFFSSNPTTQAASFTVSEISGFYANSNSFGASSVVTNQYGFNAGVLSGATNNYGFFSQLTSGSNRWNFYASGTAANFFQGRTGVGGAVTTIGQFGVTNAQSAADVTAFYKNFAAQTADSFKMQDSAGSDIFALTPAGWIKYVSTNTSTTVGAAGAASALPANPTGYIKIDIGGTEYKVPYYAA